MDNNFIMKPKVDFCFKELMPTHLSRRHGEDKEGILDVRVRIDGNIQINMEMQVIMFTYWAERSLFYLSKMYTEQIRKGQDYEVLQKCIHVGILDFELFGNGEFYFRFHMWEDSRKELYSDKLEIHILELPKLLRFNFRRRCFLTGRGSLTGKKRRN